MSYEMMQICGTSQTKIITLMEHLPALFSYAYTRASFAAGKPIATLVA